MSNLPVSSSSTAPIYWMALGTFAIGTESFMIVPLLPKIATNLSVAEIPAGVQRSKAEIPAGVQRRCAKLRN